MKKFLIAAFVSVSALASVGATAHAETFREAGRNTTQQARIRTGVAVGQVTPMEARRLERDQRRIHMMERRASRDGIVSPMERARIERAQNIESRRIERARHNGFTR